MVVISPKIKSISNKIGYIISKKELGYIYILKNVVYIPKLVFCLGVDMAVPKKAPHEFSPAGCGTLLKAWPEKKHGVWELTMDPIHEKFAIKNGS